MSLNILDFLGGDIVYVKNNFSHATGSIAGMVSDDEGIQKGDLNRFLWMNGVKRIMGFLQLDIITGSER